MTECARCGDCCDPVVFVDETYEQVSKWTAEALRGVPDPGMDEGWAHWVRHGWTDEYRDVAVRRYDPASRYQADANFITAHWHSLGDNEYRCDQFDPAARLCAAHDDRPPVCRSFPWYGEDPVAFRTESLVPQCSYLADVPRSERPEGSRPLIPLTVLEFTDDPEDD